MASASASQRRRRRARHLGIDGCVALGESLGGGVGSLVAGRCRALLRAPSGEAIAFDSWASSRTSSAARPHTWRAAGAVPATSTGTLPHYASRPPLDVLSARPSTPTSAGASSHRPDGTVELMHAGGRGPRPSRSPPTTARRGEVRAAPRHDLSASATSLATPRTTPRRSELHRRVIAPARPVASSGGATPPLLPAAGRASRSRSSGSAGRTVGMSRARRGRPPPGLRGDPAARGPLRGGHRPPRPRRARRAVRRRRAGRARHRGRDALKAFFDRAAARIGITSSTSART